MITRYVVMAEMICGQSIEIIGRLLSKFAPGAINQPQECLHPNVPTGTHSNSPNTIFPEAYRKQKRKVDAYETRDGGKAQLSQLKVRRRFQVFL